MVQEVTFESLMNETPVDEYDEFIVCEEMQTSCVEMFETACELEQQYAMEAVAQSMQMEGIGDIAKKVGHAIKKAFLAILKVIAEIAIRIGQFLYIPIRAIIKLIKDHTLKGLWAETKAAMAGGILRVEGWYQSKLTPDELANYLVKNAKRLEKLMKESLGPFGDVLGGVFDFMNDFMNDPEMKKQAEEFARNANEMYGENGTAFTEKQEEAIRKTEQFFNDAESCFNSGSAEMEELMHELFHSEFDAKEVMDLNKSTIDQLAKARDMLESGKVHDHLATVERQVGILSATVRKIAKNIERSDPDSFRSALPQKARDNILKIMNLAQTYIRDLQRCVGSEVKGVNSLMNNIESVRKAVKDRS